MGEREAYMQRCLELAQKGAGLVSPNPMVGCVIVHNDRIISEGYHHRFGGPHAEVVAISRLNDKSLLKESTLYVNLEPCSHFGKTPPCTQLILETGIPEVVIGCRDPNPAVSGNGIARLQAAGVRVEAGLLSKESHFLNRTFITFHTRHRPYIILKWAQTKDGFLDRIRETGEPPSINWITDIKLKSLVHRWRAETGAILAGAGTIKEDNPELTTRNWPGKNPLRIILDEKGELTECVKIFNDAAPTWLFGEFRGNSSNPNLRIIPFSNQKPLPEQVVEELYQQQVQSIIVEGGRQTLLTFIGANMWDEYRVFTGRNHFGNGIMAPKLPDAQVFEYQFGNELLQVGYNCKHTDL
jgi:diaminohydroxyphosphoribosylaminopyrimidine deaminase / 5-amino-6-(5-phosphoribosylamino)uracil reductase